MAGDAGRVSWAQRRSVSLLRNLKAHASMMGVCGMLGVGLALFCQRYLIPESRWSDRAAKISFWSLNLGLAWMVFATLFPLGVIQLYHSVSSGYFDARTLQFITGGANPVLEWLRLPGDVIFIVGGVLPILGTDKEGQVKYSKGDFFWQSVSLLHSECLLWYYPPH